MSVRLETSDQTTNLSWQSLRDFTASTTLSEKVWRVANDLIFVAAGLSLAAIVSRQIKKAPTALSYACYASLALAVRKVVSTLIGVIVYPATTFPKQGLKRLEDQHASDLIKNGFIIQKITLHKSGVAYDATLIGHKDTIANGKWSIHAFGNAMAMEELMDSVPFENKKNGANTLLVNGPRVGRSGGYPTRYQMGAGHEAGLQFLEKAVKATHIVFKGLSLGGGMMSEAVMAHEFDTTKVKYLGISDRTFSRLSDIGAAFVGVIATALFNLTGTELDGVSGAEKLKKLKIEHVIIQHSSNQNQGTDGVQNQGTDGVIPDRVGLASKLEAAPTRTYLLSSNIPHNGSLPGDVQGRLDGKIREFFARS